MKASCLRFIATTLVLSGCSVPNTKVHTHLNVDAALTGDLPSDPLKWRIITSGVNVQDSMMFTAFGNNAAIEYARSHGPLRYPVGSVLSVVTWKQQEDNRWFGGKIPAQLVSVEFVEVRRASDGTPLFDYRSYKGYPLKKIESDESRVNERTAYIASLRAAVMP